MSNQSFNKHDMDNYVENILAENLTLKRKLESKCQALLILNKELSECKSERDQFKLMAEKLQEKCSAFKKMSLKQNDIFTEKYEEPLSPTSQDSKEVNRTLAFEVESLRQKLRDALGDVKALRSKLNEQKSVGNDYDSITSKHLDKEAELVKQLEVMNKVKNQLEIDLQSVIDEKEELLNERDAYKCKVHRLNHEFNVLLKGENHSVIDIDSLIMENRFLQEHLQQAQEEINMANQTINKYKSMLEKKHSKSSIKFGLENLSGIVQNLSHKQVQELLELGTSEHLPNTPATISELRSVCLALLENVSDKSLALSHQKKANQILAAQICELEQKIESLKGSQVLMFPSKVLLEGYIESEADKDIKFREESQSECCSRKESSSEINSLSNEV